MRISCALTTDVSIAAQLLFQELSINTFYRLMVYHNNPIFCEEIGRSCSLVFP
jgi:hypothetical protein